MSSPEIATFRALIQSLAKEVGIPDAEPSADGIFRLELKENPLSFIRQGGSILLYSAIGELPRDPAKAAAVRTLLLSANVLFRGTGGATLGIAPEDGAVVLCLREPMQTLSVPYFLTLVEDFIATAEHWAKRLETELSVTSPQEAQVASAPPAWTSM